MRVLSSNELHVVVYDPNAKKIFKYCFFYSDQKMAENLINEYKNFLFFLKNNQGLYSLLSQWATLPETVNFNPSLTIKISDETYKLMFISVFDGKYLGTEMEAFFQNILKEPNTFYNKGKEVLIRFFPRLFFHSMTKSSSSSTKVNINFFFKFLKVYLSHIGNLFEFLESTQIRYRDLSTSNVMPMVDPSDSLIRFSVIDPESFTIISQKDYILYKPSYLLPKFDKEGRQVEAIIDGASYLKIEDQYYKIGKIAINILFELIRYLNMKMKFHQNKELKDKLIRMESDFPKLSLGTFETIQEYNNIVSMDTRKIFGDAYFLLIGEVMPKEYVHVLDLIFSSVALDITSRLNARDGILKLQIDVSDRLDGLDLGQASRRRQCPFVL